MHDHIMIIGGTGMLKAASIVLSERCAMLTSIASTRASLDALGNDIKVTNYLPLVLDWNKSEFLSALSSHIREHGYPTLVVAWLHKNELGVDLACRLSNGKKEIDLFQVLGSSAVDPSKNKQENASFVPANVKYHKIFLGFKVESGESRWLTNSEISSGVISAIDGNNLSSTVGTVSPWSARP